MKLYNNNQIVSVQSVDSDVNDNYKFKYQSNGFFGLFKRQEGFYLDRKLVDKIPKSMFKQGDLIYYKPKLLIKYSNGDIEILYFNNYIEISKYISANFYGNNWRKG